METQLDSSSSYVAMQAPPSPPRIVEITSAEEDEDFSWPGLETSEASRPYVQSSGGLSVDSRDHSSNSDDSASKGLTAYDVLGIEANATRHVIKKAFKRKVSAVKAKREEALTDDEWGIAQERVLLLEEIYKVLRNDTLRAEYDRKLCSSNQRNESRDVESSMISKAELVASSGPSALMAAGQSTLSTIPEGRILTGLGNRHFLGLASEVQEQLAQPKHEDTQDFSPGLRNDPVTTATSSRQLVPHALQPLGMCESTGKCDQRKPHEECSQARGYDYNHGPTRMKKSQASRALVRDATNIHVPKLVGPADSHKEAEVHVPITVGHRQSKSLLSGRSSTCMTARSQSQLMLPEDAWTSGSGELLPISRSDKTTDVDRKYRKNHVAESVDYSRAAEATNRFLPPMQTHQLHRGPSQIDGSEDLRARPNQLISLATAPKQALVIPPALPMSGTNMNQILAGFGQVWRPFWPMIDDVRASFGSFSSSQTRTTVSIDPHTGAMSGSQRSDRFHRDAYGKICMDSDLKNFSGH